MKDKLKAERSEIQLLDGTCICEIDAVGQKWSDDEDMAQTLVHRYNSHEALVDALEKMAKLDENSNAANWVLHGAVELAEAALASTKEAK